MKNKNIFANTFIIKGSAVLVNFPCVAKGTPGLGKIVAPDRQHLHIEERKRIRGQRRLH